MAAQIAVYITFYIVAVMIAGPVFYWAAGYLAGITLTGLFAALATNALCLRIYESASLDRSGLGWSPASRVNLGLGVLGGAAAASLVLGPPLLTGAAMMQRSPQDADGTLGMFFFVGAMLLCGAAGEEILFRGFAFQKLLSVLGPAATILPIGVIFALMHASNPSATPLGLVNTGGFGMLFGYAFLRTHDLWLPIGLHFGWNITLPLFGANVSGLKMKLTGYTIEWSASTIWSGGEYGPEGSIMTSAVLFALFVLIWKAPVRRQHSALLDPPTENALCERGAPSA